MDERIAVPGALAYASGECDAAEHRRDRRVARGVACVVLAYALLRLPHLGFDLRLFVRLPRFSFDSAPWNYVRFLWSDVVGLASTLILIALAAAAAGFLAAPARAARRLRGAAIAMLVLGCADALMETTNSLLHLTGWADPSSYITPHHGLLGLPLMLASGLVRAATLPAVMLAAVPRPTAEGVADFGGRARATARVASLVAALGGCFAIAGYVSGYSIWARLRAPTWWSSVGGTIAATWNGWGWAMEAVATALLGVAAVAALVARASGEPWLRRAAWVGLLVATFDFLLYATLVWLSYEGRWRQFGSAGDLAGALEWLASFARGFAGDAALPAILILVLPRRRG